MPVSEKIINAALQITFDEGIKTISIDKVSEVSGLPMDKITETYPDIESVIEITYRFVFMKMINLLSLPEHEWTKGRFNLNVELAWRAMVRFMLDNPLYAEFYYECRQSRFKDAVLKVEMEGYTSYGPDYAKLEAALIENIPESIDQSFFFIYLDDCTGIFIRHMIHGRLEASMENIDRIWNAIQPSLRSMIANKPAHKESEDSTE